MGHESTLSAGGLTAGFSWRVSRGTMRRVAFILMCFAPQVRNLAPLAGLAMLVVGVTLGYVWMSPRHSTRSALFFSAYFIVFGLLGLLVQLFGYVLPSGPPPRQLFFYAVTTLALVLTGLAVVSRPGGSQFVLRVLCALLLAEIVIVGLQFAYLSFGVGLAPSEQAMLDQLIEGSYGNPNNVALVLAMVLMVLIMSGYLRMSSMFGFAVILATLAAVFVTLSRTALVFLSAFLLAAMLAPRLGSFSIAGSMQAMRRLLPVLALLGMGLLLLLRAGIVTDFEDLGVVQRSMLRVATLVALDEDDSVDFRWVATSRLLEALGSLGLGTLSDQNYGEFFQPGDPALVTVNPHSYVAEMSFLFGYPGLFMALAFLAVAIWRIIAMSSGRRFLVVLFGVSVLFLQMVPSSVFTFDMFFLLVAIAGARGLQQPAVRRQAPSRAVSQVRLP